MHFGNQVSLQPALGTELQRIGSVDLFADIERHYANMNKLAFLDRNGCDRLPVLGSNRSLERDNIVFKRLPFGPRDGRVQAETVALPAV